MKSLSVLSLVALASLLPSALARYEDLEACLDLKGKWETKWEDLKSSNCFSLDVEEEHMIAETINCNRYDCISGIEDIHSDYETITDMCMEDSDFQFPEGFHYMHVLRDGVTEQCNECVVLYDQFLNHIEQMNKNGCFLSESLDWSSVSCQEECINARVTYMEKYEKMLSGICRENNPGGCGENGGITEGEIYDKLIADGPLVQSVRTANSLCIPECKEAALTWYENWGTLQSTGCLESKTDLSKPTNYWLKELNVDINCEVEGCSEDVAGLKLQVIKFPKGCTVGFTTTNANNAANISGDCKKAAANTNERTTGQIVLGLFILFVVGIVIYFAVGIFVNRCFRGRTGWEQVPHSRLCCGKKYRSSIPSEASTEEMNQLHDEDNYSI